MVRFLEKPMLLFIVLFLFLLLPFPKAAGAKDFAMPRLEIHLYLEKNGSLWVIEKRTVSFMGNGKGFYQYIPIDRGMFIHDIQVKESGKDYTFNPGSSPGPPGTYFVINKPDSLFVDWSLDAYNETRTFQLSYRVDNAVLVHEDTAELYMKFVGEDWEKGVKEVVVYLALPEKAAREQIYMFGHGPLQGRVDLLKDGRIAWRVSPLPRKTFLEGRVLFPRELVPGAVRKSGRPALEEILREEERWARKADRFRLLARLEWLAGALALAAGLLAVFLFWYKYGREYRPDFDGDYYRELPADYSPAELGILWRFGTTTTADLTATILDLAQKGYVTLEEDTLGKKKAFLESYGSKYSIIRKTKDFTALSEHERQVMDFLFQQVAGSSRKVGFKDIEDYAMHNHESFLAFWKRWKGQLKAQGLELGFFDPLTDHAKVLEISVGLGLCGFSVLAYTGAFYILFVALGLPGLVLVGAGAELRRRSQRGVNDFARWQAFRRFLLHFSEMKKATIPSLAIWEHYLVYAVTLGVAREVIQQLQVVYPSLTDGSHTISAHWDIMPTSLGNSLSPLNALENLASGLQKSFTTATSAPSSKGGGLGGGFSIGGGGGFGGGGGGIR
jgi:uncharacterized membrane protein